MRIDIIFLHRKLQIDNRYDKSYTEAMKTAISIPDPIFKEAEGLAHRLGISRSQLYAKAVAEYTKSRETENITNTLNDLYASQDDKLDDLLSSMQFESLQQDEW